MLRRVINTGRKHRGSRESAALSKSQIDTDRTKLERERKTSCKGLLMARRIISNVEVILGKLIVELPNYSPQRNVPWSSSIRDNCGSTRSVVRSRATAVAARPLALIYRSQLLLQVNRCSSSASYRGSQLPKLSVSDPVSENVPLLRRAARHGSRLILRAAVPSSLA